MFKSRKKRQQQKIAAEEAKKAETAAAATENEISKYKLLDDIHLTHDFRSSLILPQLNKDLDPLKLSRQQQHLAQLRDIPESPTLSSPPLSPPPNENDGTKQYQELAAWRHQRSQNRYSNGLFGGKQRGRPKPNQIKRFTKNEIGELVEVVEYEVVEDEKREVEAEAIPSPAANEEQQQQQKNNNLNQTPLSISSLIRQQEEEHDYSDDDEELDDTLMEELYEPDSDTEENFFFQDFSADSKKPTARKATRKVGGRRRGSSRVMSKFDLSSFARDLHDHRLSVIQPRDSRIIMTEDDELELEKLLERQRQRMSMMTVNESVESLVPPPPMPSLDLIKPHHQYTNNKIISTPKEEEQQQQQHQAVEEMPVMKSDHGSTTTNSSSRYSNDSAVTMLKKDSQDDVSQDFKKIIEVITNIAPPLKPVASISSSSSVIAPKIDQLKRSVSTTSIKSNHSRMMRSNLSPIRDDNYEMKQAARKSMSMDDIHIKLNDNEPSVTSAALNWISEDKSTLNNNKFDTVPTDTSFLYNKQPPAQQQQQPQQSKSRSLFGSLRQVSRSKTHHSGNGVTSIKGLVRNFSSSHKSTSSSSSSNNVADSGMSRAAMAVIQHNVAKHEQKKAASVIPTDPQPEQQPQQQKRQRAKSDANNGTRLISHLIARASSSRKQSTTKIVNMEEDAAAKKRAQVVRRTIIYVQPDSLHDLLKNGGEGMKVPAVPKINTSTARNTMASDGSLSPDDETIRSREYVTATKVVRQTSVRKRVVEAENTLETNNSYTSSPLSANENQSASGLLFRQGSNNKRRWQLKSVDENDLLSADNSKHTSSSSGTSSSSNNSDYLEGVELREMSDGSVVWGLVKKQGNRKSFYAPNEKNGYEHVEDEEEDNHHHYVSSKKQQQPPSNGLSPPPIPKRSPRRQPPTTDIYYSNQVTLPNLLKMMHDQHPGDDDDEFDYNERAMSSVDDQLDEMMRILTSQQQH